ncbi:hypothetical protein [Streptomyces sp. NPDC020965]|uniref:hypothetical protein n=1 Tax=Streptomyces sp. NPDC020965 TaxID=3365105 RepID=UPI0037B7EDB4
MQQHDRAAAAAYTHNHLRRPDPGSLATGESTVAERRVWHALTGHPDTGTAARSLGHEETAVATIVDTLLVRTGARSVPHLITHGHALGILSTGGVDPGTDLATIALPGLSRALLQRAEQAEPGFPSGGGP